jgi:hypothetical protein
LGEILYKFHAEENKKGIPHDGPAFELAVSCLKKVAEVYGLW